MQDIVIILDDVPGQLHRVAHTLGHAGVNIEGMMALTGEGSSVVHLLVADVERALFALAGAGIEARAVRQALVVNLPDRPDALASIVEPLASAGINITLSYVAVGSRAETRMVLVVDDPDRARELLGAIPPAR